MEAYSAESTLHHSDVISHNEPAQSCKMLEALLARIGANL